MTGSTEESGPLLQLRQPDFTADEGDPFANDRLNRQPRVEALCRLITNLEGPAVLAVAAGFGDGKTAFLRMSCAHLRSQGTRVVTCNAWLQGHTGDPLLDLMSVLFNGLDRPSVLQGLLLKLGTRALTR